MSGVVVASLIIFCLTCTITCGFCTTFLCILRTVYKKTCNKITSRVIKEFNEQKYGNGRVKFELKHENKKEFIVNFLITLRKLALIKNFFCKIFGFIFIKYQFNQNFFY